MNANSESQQPRHIGGVLGQNAIERIRKKWPDNPDARRRKIQAAFNGGFLRLGRLYCDKCRARIDQQFELLGPEYGDPVWLEAVSVDVDWLRAHLMEHDLHLGEEMDRLEVEARKLGRKLTTIGAWVLVNKQSTEHYRYLFKPPETA